MELLICMETMLTEIFFKTLEFNILALINIMNIMNLLLTDVFAM